MSTCIESRLDLVGEQFRITCGSVYNQLFTFYNAPSTPGQFLAEILAVTQVSPSYLYNLQIAGGQALQNIPSLDSTVWVPGNWVIVQQVLGVWKILNPGAAVLEDTTAYTRIHAQVRQFSGNRLIADFDSANYTDLTKGGITIAPSSGITMSWYYPDALSALISPFTYKYDCFFYMPARVRRIYGDIEFAPSITQEGS